MLYKQLATTKGSFKKQLSAVRVMVDKLRVSQAGLNKNNIEILFKTLVGMTTDSSCKHHDPLYRATYTLSISRRDYVKMVDAYVALCMYLK